MLGHPLFLALCWLCAACCCLFLFSYVPRCPYPIHSAPPLLFIVIHQNPMMTRSAACHVGFNVIADMICNVHQSVCPISASASVVGAVAAAGRKVKSPFTQSAGKQKVDKSMHLATPAAKQSAIVTPASLTLSAVTDDHPSLLHLSMTTRGSLPMVLLGRCCLIAMKHPHMLLSTPPSYSGSTSN